jgi:site-specific recombinase XerD
VARPGLNAPFFSSGTFQLSPGLLNKWLSAVALKFRLDPKRISSHSLRIGGASNLAASGVNDYVIQKMGRWKSLCFLQYIRLASGSFATAADNLSKSAIFTVNDVRLYNPAVV